MSPLPTATRAGPLSPTHQPHFVCTPLLLLLHLPPPPPPLEGRRRRELHGAEGERSIGRLQPRAGGGAIMLASALEPPTVRVSTCPLPSPTISSSGGGGGARCLPIRGLLRRFRRNDRSWASAYSAQQTGRFHRCLHSLSAFHRSGRVMLGPEDAAPTGSLVGGFRLRRFRVCAGIEVASAIDIIHDLGFDMLTFLAVTVAIVPAFKFIRVSPLFEMGLELSLAWLKALVKFAFGLGLTQVILSTLAFIAFELPPNGAVGPRILEFLFHSRPDLIPIYARAVDMPHLLELKKAGATDAILENAETSLQLGSKLLKKA